MQMPASAIAGKSSPSTVSARRCCCLRTRDRILSIVSDGVSPSGPGSVSPASIWSCTPATRIWKNSSLFELQIAASLTRSSNGIEASSASCRTRSLKSSHDSSRPKYSPLSCRSASAGGGGSGAGSIEPIDSCRAVSVSVLTVSVGGIKVCHAISLSPQRPIASP